jgi:hypothetical protein
LVARIILRRCRGRETASAARPAAPVSNFVVTDMTFSSTPTRTAHGPPIECLLWAIGCIDAECR